MWDRARSLIDQAGKLQKQFAQPSGSSAGGWEPPIDIVETANEVWVLIALPGISQRDVTVGFDGDVLSVTGERQMPAPFRRAIIHRIEIPNGRFERHIQLPVECTKVSRNQFTHGCLLVGLKKR
ncbi:MAG: HSP20 family molecular chaperone IbpA [Planctomycetota bacterium]|jgi:HSP20 family molecular chaperone IbpA